MAFVGMVAWVILFLTAAAYSRVGNTTDAGLSLILLIFLSAAIFYAFKKVKLIQDETLAGSLSSRISCPICKVSITKEQVQIEPPPTLACPGCRATLETRRCVVEFCREYHKDGMTYLDKWYLDNGVYAVPKARYEVDRTWVGDGQMTMNKCPGCGGNVPIDTKLDENCPHCGGNLPASVYHLKIDNAIRASTVVAKVPERLGPDKIRFLQRRIDIRYLELSNTSHYLSILTLLMSGFVGFLFLGGLARWVAVSMFITLGVLWIVLGKRSARHNEREIEHYLRNHIECPTCKVVLRIDGLYDRAPEVIRCGGCTTQILAYQGKVWPVLISINGANRMDFFTGTYNHKYDALVFDVHVPEAKLDFRSLIWNLKDQGIDITKTNCPNCGSSIEFPKEGTTSKCEHCGADFTPLDIAAGLKHHKHTT